MLFTKSSFTKGDIATFKMVNGDELVAKVEEAMDDGNYVLNRPYTVIPSGQGVGILPLLLTAVEDQNYTVKAQHILMVGNTIKEIQSHYIKMTTGLITNGAGLQV